MPDPTSECSEAADYLAALANSDHCRYAGDRLEAIAGLLRKVGPLVDQQSARIAELEAQNAEREADVRCPGCGRSMQFCDCDPNLYRLTAPTPERP